jgi:hypothetical protein
MGRQVFAVVQQRLGIGLAAGQVEPPAEIELSQSIYVCHRNSNLESQEIRRTKLRNLWSI